MAIALTATLYVGPILLAGAPNYPRSDWRQALLWTVLAAAVALVARQRVQRLSLTEACWRTLIDHLADTTVVMFDEGRRLRLAAGAGAQRHGLKGTEGKHLSEVCRPENAAVINILLSEAFAGHETSAGINATTTGAEHELTATAVVLDSDRRHALVVVRDVSAARKRERALSWAHERNERLFADAPHGVAVLAPDGRVLRVNAALLSILGASRKELEGSHLNVLAQPGDGVIEEHLAQARRDPAGIVETECTLSDAQRNDVQVVLRSRMLRHRDRQEDVLLTNVVDVSQRRHHEDQLAHLADHDRLTGLPNRQRLGAELRRHAENCRRDRPTGALLLLDLDHFKQVNDTLGHAVGDELLASVAALLRQGVRSTDVVARLGGDEFAVLLTQGDQQAAETVARSLVRMIAGHTSSLDRVQRRVTASVGVVTLRAARERDVDVLALADMTMYDAKEAGRNQIAVLDEISGEPPRTGARWQWQSRIEEALENDHFVLHLQPILDLRGQEVGAAEVLLRLRDGDQLVTPSCFLHIAEPAGLVSAIDAWVVRHSVALLSRLHTIQPDFRLEVNLSGLSIGNLEIERVIVDSLRAHTVDPSTLILEITETAAVADIDLAQEFAERLTALGCKFALDDFGAGFGSLYYLKHLPFDYVKIDGEFVSNCSASSVDRTIIRSIVRIARDLGKETVAEFVADKAILNVVRAEGVDHAQGYVVGEPMSEERFVELLRGDQGHGFGGFEEAAQATTPAPGPSRR